MMNNILEYLEKTVKEVPDKTAFKGGGTEYTFRQLVDVSRSIGTVLAARDVRKKPVAVYMKKHPDMIVSFFGVLQAGAFYIPIDEEMPAHRIQYILESIAPEVVICDDSTLENAKKLCTRSEVLYFKDICGLPADDAVLAEIRSRALDIDPMYVVFTSGSTGTPKGVTACHRSVIDYVETLSETLGFSRDTVFGNQAPLYFDAHLKDVYPTLKFGSTTCLIPKELFMFPVKLMEFLNENRVNTICWVVSALSMVSAFGTFKTIKPEYVHTVAFGGEVFQIKQFNAWREALPNASFTNLYGPTEATGFSCWYKVDREFVPGEVIPIGRPFRNTEVLLIKEDGTEAKDGEPGEMCIRGTAVTLGYFRNPEKTAESFVQNPLNDSWPEIIYKTGDIAMKNERGELVFLSRKDYQIKHMGHRIELGEIEAIVSNLDAIKSVCCIFDDERKKIVLYYTGDIEKGELSAKLKELMPRYMLPNSLIPLDTMPFTATGKIDRNLLKKRYMEGK